LRSEILQKWVTIRSASQGTASTVVQDEEDWCDTAAFADAIFWVDVREVSSSSGLVFLNLETAPYKDEALFLPAAPPVALSASSGPLVSATARGSQSVAPLARWLRWRLTTNSSTTWDATFRVRYLGSRASRFTPTQLASCQLWLRSDLGIPSTTTSNIQNWNDQSINQNNATTGGVNASYNLTGGVNGLPFIESGTNSASFTGTFPGTLGSSHTLFAVVVYPSTVSAINGAFAATVGGTADTAFSQFANVTPNRTGRTSTSGTNYDAVATSGLQGGKVAIYTTIANSSASSSALYINGTSVATASLGTTPGSPTAYRALARTGAADVLTGAAYEFIVYNRALSTSELIVVHRYLGGRYSVSVP
jgi:hypothetical protein